MAPDLFSEAEAATVRRAREILAERVARVNSGAQILSPAQALDYLAVHCGDAENESFHVLSLNAAGHVIGLDHVSSGSVSSVHAPMREVFRRALLRNAVAIMLAHNHPSGDATPSDEDLELTFRAHELGMLLDVRLLDHVIIAGGEARSMREDAARWARDNLRSGARRRPRT
jgi:DNA repair protein RadC